MPPRRRPGGHGGPRRAPEAATILGVSRTRSQRRRDCVHDFGFLGVLLGVLVAYPASGLALRGNDSWRGWRLLGWWPVLLVAIAFTDLGLPGDLGFMVFVALVWVWVSLMGGHLMAIARADGAPRSTTPLPDAAAPGLL